MTTKTELNRPLCPECGQRMVKAGKARRRGGPVQVWQCAKDGKTLTRPMEEKEKEEYDNDGENSFASSSA